MKEGKEKVKVPLEKYIFELVLDRDNWKTRALAYREIIRKAHNALAQNRANFACDYLQEADKIKE
jgi:hypothetical protein